MGRTLLIKYRPPKKQKDVKAYRRADQGMFRRYHEEADNERDLDLIEKIFDSYLSRQTAGRRLY